MKRILFSLLALMLWCVPAEAAPVDRNEPVIKDIETYLTELTTIAAEFIQTAPDGNVSSGKFYLMRPNRLRFQYDPPTPILMVASGSNLIFYDYELQQVNDIPLDSTIIGFLARDDIRFDKSVKIEQLEQSKGVIRITISQAGKPKDGKLTLEFANNPIQLRNMIITDKLNQVTTVSLNNARFGLPLDSKLFEFDDPRIGGKLNKKRRT